MQDAGVITFAPDAGVMPWVEAAEQAGRAVLARAGAPQSQTECEGTWFVGVDALPNAPDGSVAGVALGGRAWAFVRHHFAPGALHPAQLSVIWPGYPKPRFGESAAAARYRERRDGAHVDGILPVGRERRRMLHEPHHFIFGIALNDQGPHASPLVVWPGSHILMRERLAPLLRGDQPDQADLTETYQHARREVFESCERREIPLARGASVLLDARLLHGVAPWRAEGEGSRMIAYFRPLDPGGIAAWSTRGGLADPGWDA